MYRKTRISLVTSLTLALGFLLLAEAVPAQDLHPSRRPSPMGMARTTLADGTYVRVVYSRPYQRGRDNIFGTEESGALVPFGKVWRTGANEATEITVTGDVTFGGQPLAAGTYSLFTTPGADAWKVHVNSALGLWGAQDYDPAKDVATATASVTTLPEEESVDQLTFSFEEAEGGTQMVLRWIRTEIRVPIAPAP